MPGNGERTGRRPAWVRAFNAAGRAAQRLGFEPLPIDADRLVAGARRATGLRDSGDDGCREPLAVMARDIDEHPGTTPFARLFMRRHLIKRLSNKLRIAAALRADPAIERRPVDRPLFVLGLPRTGTTLLHRLLAVDPDNRAPLTWEMDDPVPPPEATAGTARDPRAARVAKELATLDRVAPGFRAIHELGAELPEECIALMANELTSMTFLVGLSLPGYRRWLLARDLGATYASHRRQLQLLQGEERAPRWVLKAPFHLHGLPWLLRTYPDACVVQTHRDPLQVMPSVASLMLTMREAFQDGLSPADVGDEVVTDLGAWLERAMDVRARAEADGASRAHFGDLPYCGGVAHPNGVVRRISAALSPGLDGES